MTAKDKNRTQEQIDTFWEWFSKNQNDLLEVLKDASHPKRHGIIEGLDNHLLELGLFKWGIDKGFEKSFAFTISPNGDADRLSLSRRIVAEAPDISQIEFYPYHQARNWNFKFPLFDDQGIEHKVDASEWVYVMLPVADRQFETIMSGNNLFHLDPETQWNAAHHVLQTTLGEAHLIQHISKIEFVNSLSNDLLTSSQEMLMLQNNFEEILIVTGNT